MNKKNSYTYYENKIKEILSPKRFYHSKCVANQAESLAVLYQGDPERAKLAGLLHDAAKEMPLESQLQRLKTSDILLSMELLDNPPVWHGFTAAVILEEEWEISDPEVLAAVKYHTSGRANMSGVELAVFVADYTAKDRVYPDAGYVRGLLPDKPYTAVFQGLAFGIQAAIKNKRQLLPDSVDGYNYYKKLFILEKGKDKPI